jgi:hypothetical protein
MKTFLIVSERNIGRHTGEEWDDFIEVTDTPTTVDIQEWANRIRGRIRKLNAEDVKEIEEKGSDEVAGVEVHIDAASPFNAMAINLQILMADGEKVLVRLPHVDGVERTTDDPEAIEVIEKLESR